MMKTASLAMDIAAERCRQTFAVFAKEAWHLIEPGKQFVPGWHLDAIAEHLQAVIEGDIKRLLVNMPPRHGKSSFISTLIHPWSWLHNPSLRWLCASYALNLATRDNLKCRRIIKSQWWENHYGESWWLAHHGARFELTSDQDAKMKFENTFSGYRQCTSVGSAGTTGEGGDILVIDDPHPIEQKRSDIKREAVLDWFLNTWMSRLNDEKTGACIVVGQRVHTQDVSGLILDGACGDWVHLNLPAEYEAGSPCKTYWHSGKKLLTEPAKEGWEDPRVDPAAYSKRLQQDIDPVYLWSARFPAKVIEQKKRIHGPLGFAAIFQQRPVPAGGNIYKEKDRRFFTIEPITQSYLLETPRGRVTFPITRCWNLGVIDLATSTRTSADYFCFETWAVTPYKDGLLLHCVHDHLEFNDQQSTISTEFQRFHHSVIAIEKAGYQLAMIQDCVRKGLPIKPFEPQADKIVRSTTGSIYYSNGKAYHLKDLINLVEVEKELFTFPKAPNDDIADCHAMMALVVSTIIRPGVLDLEGDDEPIDTTLSIEQILVAEAITAEQKAQAEQERSAREQEAFNRGPQINVFEWAATHEGGMEGWE
jgi:phage terminase large subunit-like protein